MRTVRLLEDAARAGTGIALPATNCAAAPRPRSGGGRAGSGGAAAGRAGVLAVDRLADELALGASRSRVARLLFAEALLLGALGGGGGILIAWAATRLLESFRPESLPRLESISIHPAVLAFALLVTLGATLVFGLVPAGNTGGANVSAVRPMPIEPELADIIERARRVGCDERA